MTFAFIDNGAIYKYPIGIAEIQHKYPDVSFPSPLEGHDLSTFNVVQVHPTEQPKIDERVKKLKEGTPIFQGGVWKQTWDVVDLSSEEQSVNNTNKANLVRNERNRSLTNCDWTQLVDAPVDPAPWAAYRQALRDIPSQPGFPWEITWPTEPTT